MCGIFAVFGYSGSKPVREVAVECSKKIRHRGPDWSGTQCFGDGIALAHERLAIVDVNNGAQPLNDRSKKISLSVNGEIYNHVSVRKEHVPDAEFTTASDCECIIPLYKKYGSSNFIQYLDGMFAFVLYDDEHKTYIVARDHMGICPLYQGWKADGSRWFSSEMKSLVGYCDRIELFAPGHILRVSADGTEKMERWYEPSWWNPQSSPAVNDADLTLIRESFIASVTKRLMCDVPHGVLLSGGLDSSLVASIAARAAKTKQDANMGGWFPTCHSFSIGLEGSPDLKAAATVAEMIGTTHHEFTFTVEDGIDALPDVIAHLETYDVTTIRASTPMYLLSRKIKAMGVKMVLSGEGADEIFGGYLYFSKAPTASDFHDECVDRVKNLHTADVLRANKSTMAWGLEVRVPFLDKDFMDVSMSIDAKHKLHEHPERIEKHILRKAFDTEEDPYLPKSVLWRQKEQFSDGVGYSWIDGLKDHAAAQVTHGEMKMAPYKYKKDTPTTTEAYYYRTLFEKRFPQEAVLNTVNRWIPKTEWGCNADPSGRAQGVHNAAYGPAAA